MKRIILTVAQFLILVKVQEEITFAYKSTDEYIEANQEKMGAIDGLDEKMPELELRTEVFDDLIDSVQHYKDDTLVKDDPEMPAVVALLEKLEAVQEEDAEETVAEETTETEEITEQAADNHADDYPGADKD